MYPLLLHAAYTEDAETAFAAPEASAFLFLSKSGFC